MSLTAPALYAELDGALARASAAWRVAALRQIANLFVSSAALYNADQVAVFDDVMCRLIPNMDRVVLAELANRLVLIDNAPVKLLGLLARHPDAAVSGPVLEHAKSLPDEDLVAVADRDGFDRTLLRKIAARARLGKAVTDVLLKRGDAAMHRRLVANPDAAISETGYARLIMSVNGDKEFAVAIAAREDVPEELRPWLKETLES